VGFGAVGLPGASNNEVRRFDNGCLRRKLMAQHRELDWIKLKNGAIIQLQLG
jgi:hypothetical protein